MPGNEGHMAYVKEKRCMVYASNIEETATRRRKAMNV